MYQLLIVDDEGDIRRGIAKGIPWQEWGFEVVGQAEHGEEAVSFMQKENMNTGSISISHRKERFSQK